MAELPSVFNAEKHKGRIGVFEPLPEGEYECEIVKSQLKKNKSNSGKHLVLHWRVTEGDYKGRLVFERLNLINQNQTAVQIANDTLGSICDACKKKDIKDSDELHNIPCLLSIAVREGYDDNPPQNEIKDYEASKSTSF